MLQCNARVHFVCTPVACLAMSLASAPAVSDEFSWVGSCGSGWFDCCTHPKNPGANTTNWGGETPKPQCPYIPGTNHGQDDDVNINDTMTNVIVNGAPLKIRNLECTCQSFELYSLLTITGTATFNSPVRWNDGGFRGEGNTHFNKTLTIDGNVAPDWQTMHIHDRWNWLAGEIDADFHGGIFEIHDGAVAEWAAGAPFRRGNVTIHPGATLNVIAPVKLATTLIDSDALIDIQSGEFADTTGGSRVELRDGAELRVDTDAIYRVPTVYMPGSTLTGEGLVYLDSAVFEDGSEIEIANAVLGHPDGSGHVALNGLLRITNRFDFNEWNIGGDGLLKIEPDAIANVNGGGLTGVWPFDNRGTVNWNGGFDYIPNGASVRNAQGGTFNAFSTGPYTLGAPFENEGDFIKPQETGVTAMNAEFTNSTPGKVIVEGGSGLRFGFGGLSTGEWRIVKGAFVQFDCAQSTMNLLDGTTFTGNGEVRVTRNLTVDSGTPITIPHLIMSDDAVRAGEGELIVLQDFTWSAGTLRWPGITTIGENARAVFESDSQKAILNEHTLRNDGQIEWMGDSVVKYGGRFNNEASGVIDLDGHVSFQLGSGSPQPIHNHGTWRINGDSALHFGVFVETVNLGDFEIRGGTVQFEVDVPSRPAPYVQLEGTTALLGGNILDSGKIDLLGGSLTGSGSVESVEVNNTGATIEPGGNEAIGALDIIGDYTQGANASLIIEVRDDGNGFEADALNISGAATFAGTLKVKFDADSYPEVGRKFTIINAGNLDGMFDEIDLPAIFRIRSNGQSVILRVARKPAAIEADG